MPLRTCVSRVMSKDNHNQGSFMEEIWGSKDVTQKGRQEVCVCVCICLDVGGVWVNCRGRRPRSTLSAALRLTHGHLFHPLYKAEL